DRCGIPFTEDGHLPLFHYTATFPAGGKRTVPVLVDGKTVLTDSTDIVAWADARKPGALLPDDATLRAEALALEDDFDRHLGPATRRWGYWYLLPKREVDPYIVENVPRWERTVFPFARPLAARMLVRGLNINADSVERSRKKIDETFARVGELIA